MYNPQQFDNRGDSGPSVSAVILKSLVFMLMVVVIVGLGYWVWWLHENRLAPPKFKERDIVCRLGDDGERKGAVEVNYVEYKSETTRNDDGTEKETAYWQYMVFVPTEKMQWPTLESQLVPATDEEKAAFETQINANRNDFREKLEIHRQHMQEHFNPQQAWEQDGSTGRL